MATTWYETAVHFDKIMEDGEVKKVSEKYLVDAVSFAEAERRTIEERGPYINGEFETRAVRRTAISDIFRRTHYRFYLAKVAFITLNEFTGKEKRTVSQILVGGDDFEDAYYAFKEGMMGTMAEFELQSLTETGILEVYPAASNAGTETETDTDTAESE